MATVYIQKESINHKKLTNKTGAAIEQYQLAVVGGYVGIADEDIAIDAEGAFHIEEGLSVQATNLTSGESTFATLGQAVYLDSAGDFADVPAAGRNQVGNLTKIKTAGVIKFTKLARAIPSNGAFVISGTPTNNDTIKFVAATGLWTIVAVAD